MSDAPDKPTARRAVMKRLFFVALALVLAWGWFRGDLMWRVRSERKRLEALTSQPVQPAQWRAWSEVEGVGAVRNFFTGERDMHRLGELTDAVRAAERTPPAAE